MNLPPVFPVADPIDPSDEEKRALASMSDFQKDGGAYANLQGTRPQTLGYGLADSPVAQAAWMFEKIDAWSGDDGNGGPALGIDPILDNISLYWITNTRTSSARYYWEVFRTGFGGYSGGQIDLPMAATIFPDEFYRAPRIWAEREWAILFYWNEVQRGGHFAAWEQPKIFVDEIRKAFRQFR